MVPEFVGFGIRSVAVTAFKILAFPRVRVVIYYRLSHWAVRWRMVPVAYFFQQMAIRAGGAEIHPRARIGRSFCLFHSSGVVIGDKVIIGENFRCFHGVTLGDDGNRAGQPTLADGVTVFAGAKVIGPIQLGKGSIVAANAVLLTDLPEHALAVGVPARIVRPKNSRPIEDATGGGGSARFTSPVTNVPPV